MPESLEPPNAVRRSRRNQLLIQQIPTSIFAATRCARARLLVHTVVASPYLVSFAIFTASVSLSNGCTWQQGPKISSCTTVAVSGSPVQIVGSTHAPSSSSLPMLGILPPVTTFAPSSTAFL